MNLLSGFAHFWYDFLVGDAWEIAAGVVLVLGIGAGLLRTKVIAPSLVPPLVAAGICIVMAVSLAIEVRRGARGAG